MHKRIYFFLISFLIVMTLSSQTKTVRSINNSWKFHKGDLNLDTQVLPPMIPSEVGKWANIDIPHTWNNQDAVDDTPGYYRGVGWYKKNITVQTNPNLRTIIYFEGANQITDLYINGKWVGNHKGGYARFAFDITSFLNPNGINQFVVKVDNSHNEAIPPLSADYTFFGGIYRDVYLVQNNAIHFAMDDYGSSGIYIRTPKVTKDIGKVQIESLLNNKTAQKRKLTLTNRIVDKTGKIIAEKTKKISIRENAKHFSIKENFTIKSPTLWSPNTPYLYQVVSVVKDAKTDSILDKSILPLGFRWYNFDSEKGFTLNGKYLKLIGTNRHQDYSKIGNALSDEIHVSDVQLLKDMGGNFLRISHYPQDPLVLQTCDRLGILTSVEIPIVNAITESEDFTKNCLEMTEEMVKQNSNHPSVIIWAYMNEVLLRPPFNQKTDKERYSLYTDNVANLASKIENKLRNLDAERFTMIPNHGAIDRYKEAGLTDIPMLLGWNLYHGWYGGRFEDLDKCLDKLHKLFPKKPLIVTEYGADIHHRLHTFKPERFDYTVEYGNLYHEHYLKSIMDRPFVVGANLWNLNDFYSESRGYALPHTNLKGITTLDREKKDTWWLYKTKLSKEPVVKFGQNQWKIRGGIAELGKNYCTQPISVYSNADSVRVTHNNIVYNSVVTNCIARFSIPFYNGKNKLTATSTFGGNTYTDVLDIDFRLVPNKFREYKDDFHEINVLLGSKRIYEDRVKNIVWIPEKEYTPGSWGYIGGNPYRPKTKFGSLPSSELNIRNTEDDPIYQTQRVAIKSFKLDLPDGRYTVTLHWAELESNIKHEKLIYNLGDDRVDEKSSNRVFNVLLNGNYIEKNLNLTETYEAESAISVKYQITVFDGNGIQIDFEPIENKTVLSAIQVRKIQ